MADETVETTAPDAGTPDAGTSDQITQPEQEITQPDAEASPTDLESLFAEPKAEEIKPLDPNATVIAPEIPKEFQEVLGISEFVKEPAQMAQAVRAADEIWGVEAGKIPAHQMLEGFRARNPEGFSKIVQENLIPYIEQITGKKLLDPGVAPASEKTPEQQRIDAIEQRFQDQHRVEQNRVIQQQVGQAHGILLQKADDAFKGTFLEGKAKDYLQQLAPHMGMSDEQATKAILAGNTAMIDKAVKSLVAHKEAEGRAYASWKIKESKTLRSALPAGKGNPRTGEPDLEAMSREQRIQFLSSGQ